MRETVMFAASGSSLACELAIAENLPPVDFDEGQMRQVVYNFVQNAREAMPGGGTLKVGASAIRLSAGRSPRSRRAATCALSSPITAPGSLKSTSAASSTRIFRPRR